MLLFMPAALWLISNNFINIHYHIHPSGVIIAHSHPYNNETEKPIQDHDHSDFEYAILALVASNSSSEDVESVNIQFYLHFNEDQLKTPYEHFKQTEYTYLPRLRAPPEA